MVGGRLFVVEREPHVVMRASPSRSAHVVAVIRRGECVVVAKEEGDWLQVHAEDLRLRKIALGSTAWLLRDGTELGFCASRVSVYLLSW